MTTPMIDLAVAGLAGAMFGGLAYRAVLDRSARTSSICPVCFGPTDDRGGSEAWTDRVEPAEGTVLVDPEDQSRGVVLLDDARVGEVDVVPAEAMLIGEDLGGFGSDEDGDQA